MGLPLSHLPLVLPLTTVLTLHAALWPTGGTCPVTAFVARLLLAPYNAGLVPLLAACTLGVLIGYTQKAWEWYLRRYLVETRAKAQVEWIDEEPELQEVGDDVIHEIINEAIPGTVGELADDFKQTRTTRRRRHRGEFVGWVATQVRAQMGPLPVDNAANRAAAWALALDVMRRAKPDHRAIHCTKQLPMIVELVLCPTIHDLEASRFRESRLVAQRKKEVGQRDFVWATPSSMALGLCVIVLGWSWHARTILGASP